MVLRTTSTVITGGVLMFVAACSVRAVGQAASETTGVPFATVARGFSSGIREPTQIVIRTHDEWVAFWGRHTRTQVAPPVPPAVDFSREMVVGVFLGEQATGGYEVKITKVERTGSELRVHYRRKAPDPGAILVQALTQPYHVIKVSRDPGPLVFFRESLAR